MMVVADSPERLASLEQMVRGTDCDVTTIAAADDHMPSLVRQAEPDLILISVNVPGERLMDQIAAVMRETPLPIVLCTPAAFSPMIDSAVQAGVSAYLTDPPPGGALRPIIDFAFAQFQQRQAMKQELETTRGDLRDRKLIERAKGMLMTQRSLSEPEAYRTLQKLAMDRKRRLADVARDVLEMAELLVSKHRNDP